MSTATAKHYDFDVARVCGYYYRPLRSCNRLDVDLLVQAFRNKEEKNKQWVWAMQNELPERLGNGSKASFPRSCATRQKFKFNNSSLDDSLRRKTLQHILRYTQ